MARTGIAIFQSDMRAFSEVRMFSWCWWDCIQPKCVVYVCEVVGVRRAGRES